MPRRVIVRAEQLNDRSTPYVRRFDANDAEHRSMQNLAEQVRGNPYADFEGFFQEVRELQERLPARLRAALREFRDAARGGALLVDNVPIGRIPDTPSQPFTHAPIYDLRTEVLLTMLGTEVAEPFTFAEWDSGHMIQNKYPLEGHRNIQFGTNAVDFLPHSETPFREFCPDYLALLCLRTDPEFIAKTLLCDIASLIERMPQSDQALLAQPLYAYPTDNPALTIRGVGMTRPMPITTQRDGRPVYEYTHDIQAVRDDADATLARLKAAVEDHTTGFVLEAGMLIIIDNSHMIHGRTRYAPRYDGRDRWLQRLLLSKRLFTASQPVRDRRIPDRNLAHYPTEYQNVLQSLTQPTP
jgi:L-asparagine oxygenase